MIPLDPRGLGDLVKVTRSLLWVFCVIAGKEINNCPSSNRLGIYFSIINGIDFMNILEHKLVQVN